MSVSIVDKTHPWWKTATGYQIYPRSFCDSNADGIGDIPGIVSKLDYLHALGVGFIWLSPVYASPMIDNGYDISNYRAVAPEFGSLDDLDNLIAEAKYREIGIVMDLVVNHSSSGHDWFKRARSSRDSPEHSFYYWRDPAADGGPPTDHRAVFGGSVWTWVPEVEQYYFHYFSAQQPDLNWQNPSLRREIYDMMNWWFDRGIAGFRMDVIDLIGKDIDAGVFEQGPDLHQFLQEMNRETLHDRDVVTVGESWSVTPDTALSFCATDRNELNMVFNFNHIVAGWDSEKGKFKPKPFDLVLFKRVLNDWQNALSDDGWNSLFLSNHDLPRAVSTYGDEGPYRVESAKMLATVIHFMKGTPFIYQGEEIGMTNAKFTHMEQFRDVETLGQYEELSASGTTAEDFLAAANKNGRDNARTPMQWSAEAKAGFTQGTPWIDINSNYRHINTATDCADENGVWTHYKKLIRLRRELPIITYGSYQAFAEDHVDVFAYSRELNGQQLIVIANFSNKPVLFNVPAQFCVDGNCVFSNPTTRVSIPAMLSLKPFETVAVLAND